MTKTETQKIEHTYRNFLSPERRVIFPVTERDVPGGVYDPLPYFKQGWQNKNRKPFDSDLTSKLMMEHISTDGFEPAQYKMLLLEYDATNESYYNLPDNDSLQLFDNTNDMRTTWVIGKVLKLGRGCFASDQFSLGAECTVGDWIMCSLANGDRFRMKNVPLLLVNDVNFIGLIDDPRGFTNA